MKSFATVALLGAAIVSAVPLNEKRDVIWHTAWAEVTETVLTTTTLWVAPGSEVSAAAANPGGDFHETAVHYSVHKPQQYTPPAVSTPTEAPPPPPAPTTSSTPPPPPPAPTTPTSTYVAPTPQSTYVAPAPKPTTTEAPPPPPAPTTPTSTYVAPTPTSVYVAPAPETTTPAAAASTPASYGSGSGSSSGSSGSSSGSGASYSDVSLTFYSPSVGTGSCGVLSSDSDMVVAVQKTWMQAHNTVNPANPNANPMCNKKISITANGVTATATIMDSCPGCKGPEDLDLSPALFQKFASESVGVITGASWKILD